MEGLQKVGGLQCLQGVHPAVARVIAWNSASLCRGENQVGCKRWKGVNPINRYTEEHT